jgi:hypothetical protein
MSAQPEVAITIMTGGRATSSDAGSPTTGEAGPVPMPLDQLSAAAGPEASAGGAPTPVDLSTLPGAQAAPAAPAPSEGIVGPGAADESPEPLDLEDLATTAEPPKKPPTKKRSGKSTS